MGGPDLGLALGVGGPGLNREDKESLTCGTEFAVSLGAELMLMSDSLLVASS